MADVRQLARVAVLEDDEALRERILVQGLRERGFDAEGFPTAAALYRALLVTSFDLALIDIGLPDEDGLSVADHLRRGSSLGIAVLTGNRDGAQQVRGLANAVDLWLQKPVQMEVLAASLQSLWRRVRMPPPALATAANQAWKLASDDWQLLSPSGNALDLAAAERSLFRCLFADAGSAVWRERLIAAVDGGDADFDPHRLDMLIFRLRRKAEQVLGTSLPLRTLRGRGYLFVPSGGERFTR